MWNNIFRSREESNSCAKTAALSTLGADSTLLTGPLNPGPHRYGGQGTRQLCSQPPGSYDSQERQGPSGQGCKDILEFSSFPSEGAFFGSDPWAKSLTCSGLWATPHRPWEHRHVRGQQWGRVSFPEAPLVSLDDKEKDVLCPWTQLGFEPGSEACPSCWIQTASWILSCKPHFWFLFSQD